MRRGTPTPAHRVPSLCFSLCVRACECVCVESTHRGIAMPSDPELIALLPPLPRPDVAQRRREACGGIALVIFVVSLCWLITTMTVVLLDLSPAYSTTFVVLIYSEGVVALICLLGLVFGDRLIRVKRNKTNCLPMPLEVSRRLNAGEEVEGVFMQNLDEPCAPFRSYCVRCFVYRSSTASIGSEPDGVQPTLAIWPPRRGASSTKIGHHCRICNHCVNDFVCGLPLLTIDPCPDLLAQLTASNLRCARPPVVLRRIITVVSLVVVSQAKAMAAISASLRYSLQWAASVLRRQVCAWLSASSQNSAALASGILLPPQLARFSFAMVSPALPLRDTCCLDGAPNRAHPVTHLPPLCRWPIFPPMSTKRLLNLRADSISFVVHTISCTALHARHMLNVYI